MGNLDIAIKDLKEKLNWYQMANMNSFKAFTEHENSLKRAINVLRNANGDVDIIDSDDSYERCKTEDII